MQQDINALLQAIYDDYQKPLRILALSLGVPEKDVDDIVQESIIAYYQHYPLDWQPRYKKSMLATIVRNKSIDYFRKYQREHVIWDSEYFLENQEISARYGDDLMDQIICEELYQDVKKAIGELSKELQAAAKLHLIEGFSEKEVAQQLGITSVACRARISRARKRLKQSLGPKYGL